jgi:hypothetical protein
MAKRPSMIKKTVKKTRVTRSEQYLVNVKYMGEEPTQSQIEKNFTRSLNWYSTMCSKDEAREYLSKWLQANGRHDDVKKLKRVSDTWLPLTACWLSRMLVVCPNRADANLLNDRVNSFIDSAFTHLEVEKPVMKQAEKPSIQDRVKEKVSEIIGDLEEILDKNEEFSLYDWLKKNEIPAAHASKIIAHYTPWLSELVEAYDGKDVQLKEAYRHLSKKQLKDRIIFFGKFLEDAHRYGDVTKKTRAPRKPRPVSMDKLLKNFKYQKESAEYKIASISPDKIVGCQELWTFNTKNKIVTVFRALDRGGLQVKRTSITGFDEKSSLSRRTGRQTENIVDKIKNSGKIVLRKLMEELKGDLALQERINENTILLKVV